MKDLPRLFFLVYYPRSGSTFLAEALTRHKQIMVAPEADFLHESLKRRRYTDELISSEPALSALLDEMYRDPKFHTWEVPKKMLMELLSTELPLRFSEIVRLVVGTACQQRYGRPRAAWYGYKKGGWYAQNVGTLRAVFSEARFVHVLRDGRAAYSSGTRALGSLTGRPLAEEPRGAARAWRSVVRGFDGYAREPFALEVRYEDLIRTPAPSLKQVFQFLNVDADDRAVVTALAPGTSTYVVKAQAHLHQRVGKAPDLERLDAWQQETTRREILDFERVAGVELRMKGYELVYASGLEVRARRVCEDALALLRRTRRAAKRIFAVFSRRDGKSTERQARS